MPGPIYYDNRFIFHKAGGHEVYFEAANQDATDVTYQYFGFVASSGAWLIQRQHVIGSAIIWEYAAGQDRTTYDACWDANGLYIGTLTFTTFDQLPDNLS